VAVHAQPEHIQRERQVRRKLPRDMEDAAATAIDVINADAQSLKHLVIGLDVCPTAATANTDRGWVLAEQQHRSRLLTQVVHDPTLKLLDLPEVDQPQQVDFQRRQCRGWPHRLSKHRASERVVSDSSAPWPRKDSTTVQLDGPHRQGYRPAGASSA